jgi:hypothetical protein
MGSVGMSPFDMLAKEEAQDESITTKQIDHQILEALHHKSSNPRQSTHFLFYIIALLCAPIVYLGVSGYVETWSALHRYTRQLTSLESTIPIIPTSLNGDFDYAKIDAEIIDWQNNINTITDSIKKMALVSFLTDNSGGIEVKPFRNMAKEKGPKKGGFHPPRDILLLTYFLLSAAIYFTRSSKLCHILLIMNIFVGGLCVKLKLLNDACEGAVIEKLEEARMALLAQPMHLLQRDTYSNEDSYTRALTLSLLKRTYLVEKLDALIQSGDIQLAIAIRLPLFHSISISYTVVVSIIAASTFRAVQVLLRHWATEAATEAATRALSREVSGAGGSGGGETGLGGNISGGMSGDGGGSGGGGGGGGGGSPQPVLNSNLSFGLSTIFEKKKYN